MPTTTPTGDGGAAPPTGDGGAAPPTGDGGAAPPRDTGPLARLREIVSGPLKLLPEALQAVPAVKYALATLAVAGCVAVGITYFKNPRIALVAMIVGFVLMGLMVIFARVAQLPGAALKLPAIVFAWSCLLLFLVWAFGMTTSVFAGWPLEISLFDDEDKEPFALIVPDRPAAAMMTPPGSPFSVEIEGTKVKLPREGLLIGEIKSLPERTLGRYREVVQTGEPARYPVKLSDKLVSSVKVTYEDKACKRPDLDPEAQQVWVLELDSCP